MQRDQKTSIALTPTDALWDMIEADGRFFALRQGAMHARRAIIGIFRHVMFEDTLA